MSSWKARHFDGRRQQQTPAPPNYGAQISTRNRYNNGGGTLRNEYHRTKQPSNLSSSAFLRSHRENENGSERKEIVWPPAHNDSEFEDDEYDSNSDSNDFQSSQRKLNGGVSYHKKPSKTFRPPPATIPLRASPPITQEAPPIYKSEPIAISYQGGPRMRGDKKWPPAEYKAQIQAEHEARVALARGPQFRPRKVKKDYSNFFAKNALPNSYSGYKAPPNTQHYDEENDYSNY